MSNGRVTVVGAGLAGAEAAYQLARFGIAVDLIEMKPARFSPAHHSEEFAELVCSNSLRSSRMENAVGLLKEEMRLLGSLIIRTADATQVPAGGALAVDRDAFSKAVTDAVAQEPLITVHREECTALPKAPAVIATGPLTSDALMNSIESIVGDGLHFYDAAAPIVYFESIDASKVFRASRYGRGEDYLNCPMTREEYFTFWRALCEAETVPLKNFESPKVFEGCMPVEVMAKRGERTLAFGPLKPVGLRNGEQRPYAVVQLRQDTADGTLWNIVGFQTNLRFSEQKRVFGLIPGLEHAEYARYGVMHRNTFLHSPGLLNPDFSMKADPLLFFAGQMTGVEGYVESAASGLSAAIHMARKIQGKPPVDFSAQTAIGSLGHYVSEYCGGDFQPMNITFGIMDAMENAPRGKQERYRMLAERALAIVKDLQKSL